MVKDPDAPRVWDKVCIIAVNPLLTRFVEGIMKVRLLPLVRVNALKSSLMGRTQLRFIPGGNCAQHVQRVIQRMKEHPPQSRRLQRYHWALVDFKNTFNSVPHRIIMDRMKSIPAITGDTAALIELLYAQNEISIGPASLKTNKGTL